MRHTLSKKLVAVVLAVMMMAGACAWAEDFYQFGSFQALNINSDGKEITDAIFSQAEYTVMHFFSSWDEDCMAELTFIDIVNEMGNGDYQIICVQIDSLNRQLEPNGDAVAKVLQLVEDMDITTPILYLFDDTLLAYGAVITQVPSNYLVYCDGDVIDSFIGTMDLDGWIDYCIWLTED